MMPSSRSSAGGAALLAARVLAHVVAARRMLAAAARRIFAPVAATAFATGDAARIFATGFTTVAAAAVVAAGLVAGTARAQSLTGVQGLVTIPTAELASDGTLTAGFNMLNRASMSYHAGRDHAKSPYLTLVYLPFLETGLRLTRADSAIEEALGDRTVTVRVLVAPEARRRPALLVGLHDFIGLKRHFQSTYAVTSKTFAVVPGLDHVSVHLGYGTKLIEAELYDFVGPFGGVAVSPGAGMRILAEYVSGHVNVGVDAFLFGRAHVVVGVTEFGLTDFGSVSGGLSYSVPLPK